MYLHRWLLLRLIAAVATIALPVARGDTGPGPLLQSQSSNTSGSFVGAGGYGLDGLLHSDTLLQTATDQQGVEDFLSNVTAYALTTSPLSAYQLAKAIRPLVQVPIALSPLVVVYKIPGIKSGELHLDSACLSGIYACSICYWNDPRIVALNPSLAQRLSKIAILPVAELDSDSTTRLFRQYVWESSVWSSDCVYQSAKVYKGTSLAESFLDGRSNIGYTEYASALSTLAAHKNVSGIVGMAALKNANGSFVAPEKHMFYPFQEGALPKSITSPEWAAVNVSASGKAGAYPMGGLVYTITDKDLGLLGGSVASAMQQFLLSLLAQPFQGNISKYGGVPLPQSQVLSQKQDIESLNTIPPPPIQQDNAASKPLSPAAIAGVVVGSTLAAAMLLCGFALCHVRYRRHMQMLQVTESIRAWRSELATEGLLVEHTDIHYERVPGSKTRYVVLGEGKFGKVCKAKWNWTTVAVKMLHDNSDSQRLAFVREALMLKELRYPNVVQYLGFAITDHNEARYCPPEEMIRAGKMTEKIG